MKIALMKEVSPNISECEITNITRVPIDHDTAVRQHQLYADAIRNQGYKIHMIPDDDLPDSVFVEDNAVVIDELGIITHPGAASRRAETASVAKALSVYRELRYIDSSGTLDGGDVLRIGRDLFVGKSCRSSAVGISLLREITKQFGYTVTSIPVSGCLHLKTAVSLVAERTLLLNPSWVDPSHFTDFECITVHPSEAYGANALYLSDAIIYPTAFPRTGQKLRDLGIRVVSVDMSELAKAEGGVTCCSLIFDF